MALIRQGSGFLLVGAIAVAADWALFVALSALGMAVVPANLCARVAGALLSFWLNGRLTFARQGQPRLGVQRLRRFVAAWILLTLISTVLMHAIADATGLGRAWLAKPLVEAVMALASFFIARHWVYR